MNSMILKQDLLADEVLGGSRVFLNFHKTSTFQFVVETRFEILKGFKSVYDASDFFEQVVMCNDLDELDAVQRGEELV